MRLEPILEKACPVCTGEPGSAPVARFRRVLRAIPLVIFCMSGAGAVSAQGFAVSYSDPNLCVASVLYATGRQILETPERELIPTAPPSTDLRTRPSDDIPDCIEVPRLTSVPGPPESVTTTPPPKAPEQSAGTGEPSSDTTKQAEENQADEPDQAPELGLVKAQETLVSLILVDEEDGQPLEGATVRLLAPEPGLPAGNAPDGTLTGADNYAQGVEGAELGDDGQLLLSVDPKTDEHLAGITLTEVIEDTPAVEAAAPKKPAATRTARVARQNPQLVVATAANWTRLPVRLAPQGAKICINRNFRIGDNNIHVVSLPGRFVDEFTRNANRWEQTEFVEADPCRNKEDGKDPLYETSGLWGQKFDNQWAIKRVGFEEEKLPQWPKKTVYRHRCYRCCHRYRPGLVSPRYFPRQDMDQSG